MDLINNKVISPQLSNDQWKISSTLGNRDKTISPSKINIGHSTSSPSRTFNIETRQYIDNTSNNGFRNRPQSPFSRLDRHKPKSPIVNIERLESTTTRIIDNSNVEKVQTQTKQEVDIVKIDYVSWNWWSISSFILTCFIPNWILSNCGKKKTSLVQQAWREKVKIKFYRKVYEVNMHG